LVSVGLCHPQNINLIHITILYYIILLFQMKLSNAEDTIDSALTEVNHYKDKLSEFDAKLKDLQDECERFRKEQVEVGKDALFLYQSGPRGISFEVRPLVGGRIR